MPSLSASLYLQGVVWKSLYYPFRRHTYQWIYIYHCPDPTHISLGRFLVVWGEFDQRPRDGIPLKRLHPQIRGENFSRLCDVCRDWYITDIPLFNRALKATSAFLHQIFSRKSPRQSIHHTFWNRRKCIKKHYVHIYQTILGKENPTKSHQGNICIQSFTWRKWSSRLGSRRG